MTIKAEILGQERLTLKLQMLPPEMTKALKAQILRGALLVETEAKRSIQTGGKSGKIYRRGSVSHRASAPGEPPATDRGGLVRSITHEERAGGLEVGVGTGLPYGKFLEFGTMHVRPRPWLYPALRKNTRAIVTAIDIALANILRKK